MNQTTLKGWINDKVYAILVGAGEIAETHVKRHLDASCCSAPESTYDEVIDAMMEEGVVESTIVKGHDGFAAALRISHKHAAQLAELGA
jgi:hypothetical protein